MATDAQTLIDIGQQERSEWSYAHILSLTFEFLVAGTYRKQEIQIYLQK